jgi:hypothetical protein
VSDLNTLAGARGGTVGATLRTRRREIKLLPREDMASGGVVAYLKVEKPRFLFLATAANIATAASPVASAGPSPRIYGSTESCSLNRALCAH